MPPSQFHPARDSGLRATGVLVVALLAGCTLVGTGPTADPAPPPPTVVDAPPQEPGTADAEANRETARLLGEAEILLSQGSPPEALERAAMIRERYPTARGASRTLWIEARAHRALEEWEEGLDAVGQYLRMVADDDEIVPEARLLGSEIRFAGRLSGAVESLFEIPEASPPAVRESALELARDAAGSLDDPLLREVVAQAPSHPWILPVFQVELAERRALMGDTEASLDLAQAALRLSPATVEMERVRSIERGEIEPRGELAGTVGALLSFGGPPSLQGLSEQIRDGIEVALLEEGARGSIQLVQEDDRGSPNAAATGLRSLEQRTPIGIVGPVTDLALEEALRGRTNRVPIIAPVATLPVNPPEGVYSLAGIDPEGSRALARLALASGLNEVMILHSRAPEEAQEAGWFREAFEEGGGRVLQLLAYAPGTTDFRDRIAEIDSRRPRGVVVFAGPGELRILATQLSVLDRGDSGEGTTILGSSIWASDQTLANLPASHTNGVLSVAPHAGPGYGPRWEAFVAAYEGHFRRTLREPVPALGYDAVLLLLEAARLGGGTTPAEVLRGMASIREVPGATGLYSVRDGRIVRSHIPVRLRNGERIPIEP